MALMALATSIWVPISVWIGLRPRCAEAFSRSPSFSRRSRSICCSAPSVSLVLRFHLNPDIWLSVLIVFGTQWYIVFNVIAGAAAFPNDLREAATNFRVHGWDWWRQGHPAGHRPLLHHRRDHRLGRLVERLDRRRIRQMGTTRRSRPTASAPISPRRPTDGDFPKIVLGVAIMSIFVTLVNRLFWRQLYAYAERRLRL